MSLKDKIEKAEEESGMGSKSDWFKFKEGANRIRVLAEPEALSQHFASGRLLGVCYGKNKGCPFHSEDQGASVKWLTWIVDYSDGEKVKLAGLPWAVARELVAFQMSEDYTFEEWPMPYDITVNAKKAGTMDVEYSVIPARKNTDIPESAAEEFAKQASPEEVVLSMKEKWQKQNAKQVETKVEYPEMNESNNASGV